MGILVYREAEVGKADANTRRATTKIDGNFAIAVVCVLAGTARPGQRAPAGWQVADHHYHACVAWQQPEKQPSGHSERESDGRWQPEWPVDCDRSRQQDGIRRVARGWEDDFHHLRAGLRCFAGCSVRDAYFAGPG